ncbi:MAG: family 43 glycosylhydrolase [Clostridium sp.]|nr:family 43 glycosylhydrolase [Clostridium sp.]
MKFSLNTTMLCLVGNIFVAFSSVDSLADEQIVLDTINRQIPIVHDPVMACEGNTYYLYYTDWNVGCLFSHDMMNWSPCRKPMEMVPDWALKSVPGYKGHTWAPDVVFHNGKYHLYYSCSSFGKNTSAIGHAESVTLCPDSASYGWKDTGPVIRSKEGQTDYNAIDPAVFIDRKKRAWMTFGSFWGGIQLVPLSEDLCQTVGEPIVIARRTTKGVNPIEAPFLFRRGRYYYLFVSWDYCCQGSNSTYKVAVGRSRHVTGPYLDREGKPMTEGGGTVVLTGGSRYAGAGHCSVYHIDGKDYLLAHGYVLNESGTPRLILSELTWSKDGWPVPIVP